MTEEQQPKTEKKQISLPLNVKVSRSLWPVVFSALKRSYRMKYKNTFISIQREVLQYGSEERMELLELMTPKSEIVQPLKTPIIYLHGGGWKCGSFEWYSEFLTPFVLDGFPVFNANYALAPEFKFPNSIISVLKLLQWIQTYKFSQNFRTDQVVLMGDSAGGNVAVMSGIIAGNPHLIHYVTKDDTLSQAKYPEIIKIISLYSPLERQSTLRFPRGNLIMSNYCDTNTFDKTITSQNCFMPIDLDFNDFPSILMCCGTSDYLYESNVKFHAFLQTKHPEKVKFRTYANEKHGLLNRWWRENSKRLVSDILLFLNALPTTEFVGDATINEKPEKSDDINEEIES